MHREPQVRQSQDPGFKSRCRQIAHFHGVKIRLSTLGTGDVPCGSVSTKNSWVPHKIRGHKRTAGEAGIATIGVSAISGINWDYIGQRGLSPSGVRFVEVSFRNYLVNWVVAYMARIGLGLYISGLHIAGIVIIMKVLNVRGRALDGNQIKLS